ncbi:FAM192A_Fyv6_N domain-containing protein [Caenorhabditis elegans]|uniref:FAM192A_Fyv6_N domain-containing protein n=1 Tax=Caenorhabditis elegans TaxID=6239 RepID=O02076_CAEEL|nr:FAM192A_Fyv6_N domain-containing protein [Caenorhabditis elegans]CCD69692.1 FAM192A_Fyv6_N domain-containing protein [Caenorhabditis elegans]|eukprot:NP_494614.1 Uncharacterized protein CELE_F19B10.1 [Caenorhabditis elegans]
MNPLERKVKQEAEEDGYSSFDEFPAGAIRIPYEELMAKVRAKKAEAEAAQDLVNENSFDQFVAAPPAPPVQKPAVEPSPSCSPETVAVQKFVTEFMQAAGGSRELRIIKDSQETKIVWKTSPAKPKAPPVEDDPTDPTDSQVSTVSSIIPVSSPRGKRRIVVSSDKDSDGDETPTEDNVNNDDQDVTPKKNRKPPVEVVTPSPAKRLRGLNLRSAHSSSDSESDFQDTQCEDSQDSDYFPDTQEQRDRPADFRIPKNAAYDPLDLSYN